MQRRYFLGSAAALALAGCSSGSDESGNTPPPAAQPKAVVAWNRQALEAIRIVKPGPPMAARSLAILHTAMYDAWAAYDPSALGTRLKGTLRRPAAEFSPANKTRAMSYAAHAALVDQFPAQKASFDAQMTELGFAVDAAALDPATPQGVGNLAAKALLELRRADGSNQDGKLSASGVPYSDYTNYVPLNPPAVFTEPTPVSSIVAPDHWRPVTYFDDAGTPRTPDFIAAHWGRVAPFALTRAEQFRPSPPEPFGTPRFLAQAERVIATQRALTDRTKVIAEYWADGPKSELPPGHWCLFSQFVSERDGNTDEQDVKMFFAVTNAVFDASIAVWESKRFYDYVRPLTAIRQLKAGQTIMGFGPGGPAAGLVPIQGEAWRTFQVATFPTPPFPEYVSGHSGFSAAGAEALKRFTGSDAFGASYTQPARSLRADLVVPAETLTLRWDTFSEAADQAGISRIYGGIHFDDGDLNGRALGRLVGAQAYAKAAGLWEGTAR